MKVWIDLFSGDEMVSDSYKYEVTMNDACLEVKAKFITKPSDNVKIACKYWKKRDKLIFIFENEIPYTFCAILLTN